VRAVFGGGLARLFFWGGAPFFILYAVAIPLVLSAKELPPVL